MIPWPRVFVLWAACGLVGVVFNWSRRSARERAMMRGALNSLDPIGAVVVFLFFLLVVSMGPAGLGVAVHGWYMRGQGRD